MPILPLLVSRPIAVVLAIVGSSLLLVSLVGFLVPMRAAEVNGYEDFAGGATTDYQTALDTLDQLAETSISTQNLVTEATRVFHHGIAHIRRADIIANGYAHYGMRVPVTENWILFALSYLKPDTYRDYEFCSYRKALERGTGRCGQQALGLVGFLAEQGVDTGFVRLGGHAIATAEVSEANWFLLDPDYGGVIPFDIQTAEKSPAAVLDYYWNDVARQNRIDKVYAPANEVRFGGPERRYPRACRIEKAAYVMKWAVPLLLFVPLIGNNVRTRRRRSHVQRVDQDV